MERHHMGSPYTHFFFSTSKMGRGQRVVYCVRIQFFEVGLFLGRHSCLQQPRP